MGDRGDTPRLRLCRERGAVEAEGEVRLGECLGIVDQVFSFLLPMQLVSLPRLLRH
jgi:hypothetical protein